MHIIISDIKDFCILTEVMKKKNVTLDGVRFFLKGPRLHSQEDLGTPEACVESFIVR